MAATTYVYSIATALGGSLNPDLLTQQISDSGMATGVLDYISTVGDALNLNFADILSSADKILLDGDGTQTPNNTPPGGSVLGEHTGISTSSAFQFWESNPAQSTELETYQEAMSRTAAAVSGGVYRLSWYAELRLVVSTTKDSICEARFSVDGVVKGNVCTDTINWHAVSGWERHVMVIGDTPVLALNFRRDPVPGGDDTVEIRKMKLGIERM